MKSIKLFWLVIIITSCVEDVDFDQNTDFMSDPVVETSLIYFKEPANALFLDANGVEVLEAQDATVLEILNSDFIVDNAIKAKLTFKIKNSIKRALQTRIDFVDQTDVLQHTFTVVNAASNNNETVISDYTVVFEGDNLLNLKATNKIIITILLSPSTDGSTINQNTIGNVELNSKATFYLQINTGE